MTGDSPTYIAFDHPIDSRHVCFYSLVCSTLKELVQARCKLVDLVRFCTGVVRSLIRLYRDAQLWSILQSGR